MIIAEGLLHGILARAVFVIDGSGEITYSQEPNYDAALSALRALVQGIPLAPMP